MSKTLTIDLADNCRICFSKRLLMNIFIKKNSIEISSAIMSLAKVNIYPNDGLPNKICQKCFETLTKCIQFVSDCEKSDLTLRKFLRDDDCNELDSESNAKILNLNETDINEDNQNQTKVKTKNKEHKLTNYLKEFNLQEKTVTAQCYTCGRVLSSRSSLKTHLLTHSGEKPFSCTICDKSFTLKQNLSVHMRIHTGEKPHQCSICGESFAQLAGYISHEQRKHSGRKPYQCTVCPKNYTSWPQLQYHICKHTGDRRFECDNCGRRFIARNDLKRHIATHTGIKPHVCCICGKKMSRAYHLKLHLQNSHGNDKKISCSSCSAKFCKKADLDRHTKSYCVPLEQECEKIDCAI